MSSPHLRPNTPSQSPINRLSSSSIRRVPIPSYHDLSTDSPQTRPTTPTRDRITHSESSDSVHIRQSPSTPKQSNPYRPSTPTTLSRATRTALPVSPPTIYTTPPSSYAHRFNDVELTNLTPKRGRAGNEGSPFDDRHSIHAGASEDMSALPGDGSPRGKQKTISGYQFTSLSPRGHPTGDMTFGEQLNEVVQIPEHRRSIYPPPPPIPSSTLEDHMDLLPSAISPAQTEQKNLPPIKPSFKLLFSLTTKSDILFLILPGLITAGIAALVPPYMTIQIGESFAILAAFPLDTWSATPEERSTMYSKNSISCLSLTVAGLIALITNYGRGVFWTRYGEKIADRLRKRVYDGVSSRGMEWFDMGMGMKEDEEGEESVGAGGLMIKFTRIALGLATGEALQFTLTFLVCFILAMVKAALLALVILSTIPLVMLLQIIAQILVAPHYSGERRAFAEASTNIERATSAISTVKAHNAQQSEEKRFVNLITRGRDRLYSLSAIWGAVVGVTDFLLLAMFVVGFWYGAEVVRSGKAGAGDVMTVFWSCLIASSYLQQMVAKLTYLTKGKVSMASMLTVIQVDERSRPSSIISTSGDGKRWSGASLSPTHKRSQSLRGIRPNRCRGEFDLRGISFAYPSRPEQLVLRDIKLFLPPGETTFIVGGSGSGKSTIAQLLLRLYRPNSGSIQMDDQDILYLDEEFLKENVAAVQQGCILFDMSIHDNVAMGLAGSGPDGSGKKRRPEDVSREEVEEACRMAFIHEFVVGLPEGYETKLGNGGSNLSGGQKQRLAIARARIRDPTVLILDEATSALDATSRVTVFENIKKWRKNRTTIVITHDLSQIQPEDFVYVMKDGIIAEQGFRSDLSRQVAAFGRRPGVFALMAAEQAVQPLPIRVDDPWHTSADVEEVLEMDGQSLVGELDDGGRLRAHTPSFQMGARPGSMMYLELLEDYVRGSRYSTNEPNNNKRLSASPSIKSIAQLPESTIRNRESRRLSTAQRRLSWSPQDLEIESGRPRSVYGDGYNSRPGSRMSRQISYESTPKSVRQSLDNEFLQVPFSYGSPEKGDRRTITSLAYRKGQTLSQNLEDELKGSRLSIISTLPPGEMSTSPAKVMGITSLLRKYIKAMPQKYLLVLGVICSVGHGIMVPIWSAYISTLMTLVGAGGTDKSAITKNGLILLLLCLVQAVTSTFQYYFLERLAARWTTTLRQSAYNTLLQQDREFFDKSENSPERLVQILIKDADDMRPIVASILGKFVVVITMIGLGIVWAMVLGWRLTLLGLACGPFFMAVLLFNSVVLGRYEIMNKECREALGRTFYEAVANVRGIRAMALDGIFLEKFNQEAEKALQSGYIRTWIVALGNAASASLPLFAQALMTWATGLFMRDNLSNYPVLLQVYSLVLFSLTLGAQALDFIPAISKSKVAARDFNRIYDLSTETSEASGTLRFPITGNVTFTDLSFAYPTRPDVQVFSHLNLSLKPGECVAIVGPSGSGKSTIAALLQRLYLPTKGTIHMDRHNLASAETKWLRNHIAIVSQSANLFDASVAENIAYGSEVPIGEIHRAAIAANIHEFILGLPQGYETNLGENASLISGGQAQRLQIARALVRRSNILILDECTSALDVDNQRAILDTILKIKDTRTTIFITHSLEAMKRCDRVICLGDGRVAEEGSFEQLITRRGVFADLMQSGEWE